LHEIPVGACFSSDSPNGASATEPNTAAESAKWRSIASADEERKVYQEVRTPALSGAKLKAELVRKAAEKSAPAAMQKDKGAPSKAKARALARQSG
jgi:hypothetical protein